MQANGAEMMRIAMIQMVKEGIEVCAPVHDAFLIEAPLENLEKSVHRAQEIMAERFSPHPILYREDCCLEERSFFGVRFLSSGLWDLSLSLIHISEPTRRS